MIAVPDLAGARSWYASPAYQAILPLWKGKADGAVFLIEGVDVDHRGTDVLLSG